MADTKVTPLDILNEVVVDTASHIQDFTKSPTDFTRNRKLNAETTLKVILNMQGNSLNAELLNAFPDIDQRMTASAFEQAKGKLTPEAFRYIFNEYNKAMPSIKLFDDKYRLYAIDGSDFTTPYNPASDRVISTSSEDKPICITHANILYDIENKTYQDCILEPRARMNERKAAVAMLERLDNTSPFIVIMDRGYEGLNMIEHCNRIDNCFYIIRGKSSKRGSTLREIEALPDTECDVDIDIDVTTSRTFFETNRYTNPKLHHIRCPKKQYKEKLSENTRNKSWDFGTKGNVKFRVVKFKINEDGKNTWEVLITNLSRFEFPLNKLKEMYHMRWDIETSFRSLKYALGGINFHSKRDDFIDMEILAHLIMYNVVSQSIAQVNVIHKNSYAIDFKMACHIIRRYFHRLNTEPYEKIYSEILKYINPIRLGRADKRKMKTRSPVWFVYRVA